MRKFIKKLRETSSGSLKLLGERELFELKEFFESKGYRIIAKNHSVSLSSQAEEHEIRSPLTERDAVLLFKTLVPETYNRKNT